MRKRLASLVSTVRERPYLQKVLKNSGWLYFDKLSRLVVSLLIGIFIVRYLGPADFGDYSFVLAIVGTIGPLAAFGISTILTRDLVKYPEKRNVYLCSAIWLRVILGFATIVVLWLALFVTGINSIIIMWATIVSLSFIFDSTSVFVNLFDADLNSKFNIYVGQLVLLITSILKVIFLYLQFDVFFFIGITLVESILSAAFLFIIFTKAYPDLAVSLSKTLPNLKIVKELYKSGFPFMLAGLGAVVYMHADQVVVGYMLLPISVGFYAIAVKLSEFFYFIPAVFSTSLFPKLVTLHKHHPAEYQKRLQEFFDLLTLIVVPSMIAISLLSSFIVTLMYGSEYAAAAPILSVYAISSIFVFFGMAAQNHLIIEDLGNTTLYRAALGAVLNVVLSIIFVYYFGLIGAAYATLVCFGFTFWASFILFKKTRFLFAMFLRSFNFSRTVPHFLKKALLR